RLSAERLGIVEGAAGRAVLYIAAILVVHISEASREDVPIRRVERDPAAIAIEVAERPFGDAAKFSGGRGGHERDRAACRVAAEQGSLGSAHHFQPLQIREIESGIARAAQIDAVDIQSDAGIDLEVDRA